MKITITLLIIALFYAVFVLVCPIKRISLPEGNLEWSTQRPTNAKLCVPAAFTTEEGEIFGAYTIDGVQKNSSNGKVVVSLKGNSFIMYRKWKSDCGFQQYPLVYDNKTIKFKDKRRFVRRALCKDKSGKAFLLESRYPMTLNDFAVYCKKQATNAVYLDMGSFGFGYYKKYGITIPLSLWACYNAKKQTNWLYVK